MLALSTYVVDEFSLLLVEIKRIRKQGESKIPLYNSSGGKRLLVYYSSNNKLLSKVAFRILSNILSKTHDGTLMQK